jgi:hypothetical protein
MIQGKIEPYHRSMKNQILLENYYLPAQLEQSIGECVEHHKRFASGLIDISSGRLGGIAGSFIPAASAAPADAPGRY